MQFGTNDGGSQQNNSKHLLTVLEAVVRRLDLQLNGRGYQYPRPAESFHNVRAYYGISLLGLLFRNYTSVVVKSVNNLGKGGTGKTYKTCHIFIQNCTVTPSCQASTPGIPLTFFFSCLYHFWVLTF